jgi:hypothetical protein
VNVPLMGVADRIAKRELPRIEYFIAVSLFLERLDLLLDEKGRTVISRSRERLICDKADYIWISCASFDVDDQEVVPLVPLAPLIDPLTDRFD